CKWHAVLSFLILLFVVLLVSAAGYMLQPVLVGQVPVHGFFQSLFKLQGRLPAQLLVQLGGIYSIAQVVAGAVLYKSDQLGGSAGGAFQLFVHDHAKEIDQVNVLPLVNPADIVCFTGTALMEDGVYGAGMV